MDDWKNVGRDGYEGAHYSVFSLRHGSDAMAALRAMFPDGEANDMNAVLFSTSGVHGTYNTIEEVEATLKGEASEDDASDVTFVVVQPRRVSLFCGNVTPKTLDDIAFLKKLRATSHAAFASIGTQDPSHG